jgi:hypothetical protein
MHTFCNRSKGGKVPTEPLFEVLTEILSAFHLDDLLRERLTDEGCSAALAAGRFRQDDIAAGREL